jgi:hypothetical protein
MGTLIAFHNTGRMEHLAITSFEGELTIFQRAYHYHLNTHPSLKRDASAGERSNTVASAAAAAASASAAAAAPPAAPSPPVQSPATLERVPSEGGNRTAAVDESPGVQAAAPPRNENSGSRSGGISSGAGAGAGPGAASSGGSSSSSISSVGVLSVTASAQIDRSEGHTKLDAHNSDHKRITAALKTTRRAVEEITEALDVNKDEAFVASSEQKLGKLTREMVALEKELKALQEKDEIHFNESRVTYTYQLYPGEARAVSASTSMLWCPMVEAQRRRMRQSTVLVREAIGFDTKAERYVFLNAAALQRLGSEDDALVYSWSNDTAVGDGKDFIEIKQDAVTHCSTIRKTDVSGAVALVSALPALSAEHISYWKLRIHQYTPSGMSVGVLGLSPKADPGEAFKSKYAVAFNDGYFCWNGGQPLSSESFSFKSNVMEAGDTVFFRFEPLRRLLSVKSSNQKAFGQVRKVVLGPQFAGVNLYIHIYISLVDDRVDLMPSNADEWKA